ncbi:aminodeoxychorismate/anthranilate synthase component II [Aquabacterium sp. CECT 9606]|uniref:aminodeoxychorismate/anthranilate synthase component II n=1 Tax=Aquabacterium sp. CECT 9606 TaxID=2845822 RepID=UPI001E41DD8E|nr:aminodeoxychorismate/anthranilate synthase component II [Aquabacterium sp. CECT 9606]CAH0350648.1 Aminodeoxychorismate synthase component 2 [Aquabacterium sp. CECT 9606]
MLLMIDNYDSFTFNLVQYFAELGEDVRVVRNDEITLDEIAALKPDRLVLSPGPCSPAEAGVCVPALQRFTGQLPILGVCLGHQAIGAALGGKVIRAQTQMHGKTSVISTDQKGVYKDLPDHFTVIRYHSLAIEKSSLPDFLEITSTSEDGEIMGVRHKGPQTDKHFAPLEGVQFHPESILTEHGHAMLKNFLTM